MAPKNLVGRRQGREVSADLWLSAVPAWDLGPDLIAAREQVSEALRRQVLGPHLVLETRLDGLEAAGFTLTDRGVEVLARLTGTAALTRNP